MHSVLTMAMKDLTLMRRDWLGMCFMLPPCAVLIGGGTVCLVAGVLALSRAMS